MSRWIVERTFVGRNLVFFIESFEWVYLLGATNIVGDVWTLWEKGSEFQGIHPMFWDES